MDVCLLCGAEVETEPYLHITCDAEYILGKVPPPIDLPRPYVLSDRPVEESGEGRLPIYN
jgi:hypothetical protein